MQLEGIFRRPERLIARLTPASYYFAGSWFKHEERTSTENPENNPSHNLHISFQSLSATVVVFAAAILYSSCVGGEEATTFSKGTVISFVLVVRIEQWEEVRKQESIICAAFPKYHKPRTTLDSRGKHVDSTKSRRNVYSRKLSFSRVIIMSCQCLAWSLKPLHTMVVFLSRYPLCFFLQHEIWFVGFNGRTARRPRNVFCLNVVVRLRYVLVARSLNI